MGAPQRSIAVHPMEKITQQATAFKRLLLGYEDLSAKGIPYSRASIYRKIRDGSFPQPVKLGGNKIAWLNHEIDAWIDAIAAARNPRAA
jgi:predicted DNA-binding transcriptional regulator AlpA